MGEAMEDNIYVKYFEEFFGDVREQILKGLYEAEPKYKELEDAIREVDEKAIMASLPKKERKILKEYIANIFEVSYMEQRHCYMQGCGDCVWLLKHIGAFRV